VTWTAIGEPKLEEPTPAELSLLAPTEAWPHVVGGVAGNGRAALSLGYARTTRFVCELPEGPPVLRLLALGDRVLAIRGPDPERRQRVELIDGDGQHVRTIEGLHGDWALDVRAAMLLGRTPDAELGAWSLTDPERPPILVFNRLNGRELDALRFCDETLVIVTHQAKLLGGPPPDVLVDVVRIPSYDDVSRWRSLRSRTRVAERIAEGLDRVVLGFDPAGLMLASSDELWWADWYLRERGRLDPGPSVLPLQAAPRGDGSSWLLTEREGRTELWHIAVGVCDRAFVLDPALVDGVLLIGPDDAVVISSSSQIACIAADGPLRWSFPRFGAATGLIDPGGVALYSDRGMLISTDPLGARASVWTAPEGVGRVDRLGPLAATATRMWVGAGQRVFGLE
jgi:hypothetical protein